MGDAGLRTLSAARVASGWERHGITWSAWRQLATRAKLSFAWDGVRVFRADLRRRGFVGRVLAVALAPVAAVYVIGSVLRDGVFPRAGTSGAPRAADREAYLRRRYGGSQRIVNWREQHLVASLLGRIDRPTRVLDVPSGYGRFVPALDVTVVGQLVCADIDRSRLTALRHGASGRHPPSAVQADLRGALPFATGTFDLVFNLRYLHHAEAGERRRALAELARVSSRHLLVSYYRRSNLHALVRELQAVTRGNRRRGPAMLERHEFERLLREVGCRTMREKPLFPWFHAQRVVLLEKQRASDGSAAGRVREHPVIEASRGRAGPVDDERRIPHPGRRPLSSPATAQRTLHARRRGRRGLPD